jgi:hypothetical protein
MWFYFHCSPKDSLQYIECVRLSPLASTFCLSSLFQCTLHRPHSTMLSGHDTYFLK